MASKQGTTMVSGFTEVVEAQKPVQLSTESQKYTVMGVWITPSASNTGTIIAIGGSKAGTEAKKELGKEKGMILEKTKGTAVFVEVNDLSAVWIDVEKSKDGVSWVAVLA